MKVRNILLTGDDGYNSIGTRLLVHYLKPHYKLFIAGTKDQQSGVGGKINFMRDISWKEVEVDKVGGICVDGTPADAIEVAKTYYRSSFDLVISGINLGANVGGSFFASGTIAAILRSILIGLSKKGISISYHISNLYNTFMDHGNSSDISSYLGYPGKKAYEIIMLSIQKSLWNSEFININLPTIKTNIARFTQPLGDLTTFYNYPGIIDRKKKIYKYPMKLRNIKSDESYDSGTLQNGYISITPCISSLLDKEIYKKLKGKTFHLK